MYITISVNGRRHAFDFATQLYKRSMLYKLVTPYPKFKAEQWGLPRSHIISLLPVEIIKRFSKRFPLFLKNRINLIQNEIFDRWVANTLKTESDMFVGWSGSSLHSLRKSKTLGMVTIIKRASAHILSQQKLIKDEYDKLGIEPVLANKHIVEKELIEYQEADYIDIPSTFVRRSFLNHGIKDNKLVQVPYGVDLSGFRQVEKEDSLFRIIYAGSLRIPKGSHYLLQAIYELNLPNFELWHLGSVKSEMKKFIRKYKSDKIVFKGHKPQNELYKYYSQGSVFVMPSIQEGLALVQPQAMACGLPLICTTNTGGEDLIEQSKEGFVIPIRDVEALKEKILYLYENQDVCKEMGQSAREKVASGFSWDDYAQRMILEYHRILNERQNKTNLYSQ